MKNYDFISRMILRIPRFPVNKSRCGLQEMLLDQVFQEALYLASDTLYGELMRVDFQLDKCSEKIRNTLSRYHKRMCYRATPFGSFAGICVIPVIETSVNHILVPSNSFQTMVYEKCRLYGKDKRTARKRLYCVNPFLYRYGFDYRIILKDEKEEGYVFSITEIFDTGLVRRLLACRRVLNRATLVEILKTSGIDKKDLSSYITELLLLQIIIPQSGLKANTFPSLLGAVKMKLPGSAYHSYCKSSACGSISGKAELQLREGLSCLAKLSSQYRSPALVDFKERFSILFDRKEVSLLHALDPEMGVDYAGLSREDNRERAVKSKSSMSWTPVHELLLGKWTSNAGTGIQTIDLAATDLDGLDTSLKGISPPGVAVIFSLLDDGMYIKGAGGVSGLNLIGRFTALDPEILGVAKEIAERETSINPGVIFAEITHQDSPKTYSVNRRTMVYDYQIPFFENREVGDEFVIELNDLFVSMADGKLILRSGRLDKMVIPRFSSAYNYQNSSFPVFRFLCDLQYEGSDMNFDFSMANLFPGLPAYPRISYKQVILEAASWHVEGKTLAGLTGGSQDSQYEAFLIFASGIGLPDEFCFEEHDHLLHIHLANKQDVILLLKTIPKSGIITFREYFKSQETLVKDTAGNSYTHECIAFLINNDPSYVPILSQEPPSVTAIKEKSRLFPFDEWLYLKIYLHPVGYKELLLDYVYPFITDNLRDGNISSWFFISYSDDDFHLRLRMRQVAGRAAYLLKTYRKWQKSLSELPNVKKLEMSTYEKESERYSGIGIGAAENLFMLSSEWMRCDLANSTASRSEDNYSLFAAIRHVLIVCKSVGWIYREIGDFAISFTSNLTKQHKIAFDKEFRQVQNALRNFLKDHAKLSQIEARYISELAEVVRPLEHGKKINIVADLNHMHLNRHFLHDQPFQETKTYYFLEKLIRSLINY